MIGVTLPIGSEVKCRGYGQWGMYTFTGTIEAYTHRPYDENTVTGYKVRMPNGTLDTIWLRDAELV